MGRGTTYASTFNRLCLPRLIVAGQRDGYIGSWFAEGQRACPHDSHKIPTKREYGRTYYSKEHLEELRRTDLMNDDNYYTTEQVQQLYGLTSANICHIVKVHHISKVKVGVKNLLLKTDTCCPIILTIIQAIVTRAR